MDFGLAMSTLEGAVSEIAGTPGYTAPEQLVREPITERTDLYALGLVLYEIFIGRPLFVAHTFEERLRLGLQPSPSFGPEIDPRVAAIIRYCLAKDPSERPTSASSVAALVPGCDQLAAALAAGQVPSPDIVAAASTTGALRPSIAWALLIAVVAGAVGVASRAAVLNVAPSSVPKPPEALAERAKEVLLRIGHSAAAIDSEFWFATGADMTTPTAIRFVYRQSPRYLVPENLLQIVSVTEPPADVAGDATVTLNPSGRLVSLARISDQRLVKDGPAVNWTTFFVEAGLDEREFVRVEADRAPLVPHDSLAMWARRPELSTAVRVTGASLGGSTVYFEVAGVSPDVTPPRSFFLTGRAPAVETLLGIVIIAILVTTTVVARRNLRTGEGDRAGARKLAILVGITGLVSSALRAHHVPLSTEEVRWALHVGGWSLVWAGFSWMAYVSFEPYVRRLWPGTLISWTRVLSGRVRDPLIGRDVLVGLLAAVAWSRCRLCVCMGPEAGRQRYCSRQLFSACDLLGARWR